MGLEISPPHHVANGINGPRNVVSDEDASQAPPHQAKQRAGPIHHGQAADRRRNAQTQQNPQVINTVRHPPSIRSSNRSGT